LKKQLKALLKNLKREKQLLQAKMIVKGFFWGMKLRKTWRKNKPKLQKLLDKVKGA